MFSSPGNVLLQHMYTVIMPYKIFKLSMLSVSFLLILLANTLSLLSRLYIPLSAHQELWARTHQHSLNCGHPSTPNAPRIQSQASRTVASGNKRPPFVTLGEAKVAKKKGYEIGNIPFGSLRTLQRYLRQKPAPKEGVQAGSQALRPTNLTFSQASVRTGFPISFAATCACCLP